MRSIVDIIVSITGAHFQAFLDVNRLDYPLLSRLSESAIAPYGTWQSLVSAERLTAFIVAIGDLRVCGDRILWTETIPEQGGRSVVATLEEAGGRKVLSADGHHVQTRVHEYGGTPYVCVRDCLVYSNYRDQRLYAIAPGKPAIALTGEGYRYADPVAAPDGRSFYCVREDHTRQGEPANAVVRVDIDQDGARVGEHVLFDAADFVAYPRPSPDGRKLALIAWDHPHRPWDSTRLLVADIDPGDGTLSDIITAAGGTGESVLEPQWDTDGTLYFVSDRSDWWNLYRLQNGGAVAVAPSEGELTGALWHLGVSSYVLTGDGRAVASVTHAGIDSLVTIDLGTGVIRELALPYVCYSSLQLLSADAAVMIARATDDETCIIKVNLMTAAWEVIHRAGTLDLDASMLSKPQSIWFPTHPGVDGESRHAHAFFYPPRNPRFRAPTGEKPPLIAMLHGGPTAHSTAALSLGRQYWTSRGFAVVDVNYGGSTSFGRRYRERLYGQWGVVDLQDVVAAVDFLVASERVDPDRVAIRGGSAGGYLVLAALAFTDRFRAGTNYFGVADIELLLRQTHKFESRYGDALVGPLPASRDLCRARSPLYHLDGFRAPLLTLQGADDKVVPPNQSELIVDALKARGIPVAYIPFEGEQHGFRKPVSIVRAHEAELYFYGRVFGFRPADTLVPIPIDNLP
jgi:dipeptidyl aminopeptidase/acylaminoacyl peptidase